MILGSLSPRPFMVLRLQGRLWFSVSKAVYGSPLTAPGEFLGSPELPLSSFLWKIETTVAGFAVPLPHHRSHSPTRQLPPALLAAEFLFVREDSSTLGDLLSFWRGKINTSASSLDLGRMLFLWIG